MTNYATVSDYNIHKVPGRVPGEQGVRIVDKKQLAAEAFMAKRQANYLMSPRGIMEETVRGIPKAAKEMSKAMVDYLKKRIK